MRKPVYCKLASIVLVGMLAAASCSAQIVVKPSDLVPAGSTTGWSLVNLNGGNAIFCVAPLGGQGYGALLCVPGGDGSVATPPYPGQIWMGTNEYNGTALSALTELSYDTWLTNAGIYKTKDTFLKDKWSGPKQQITLQMCIDPGDGNPKRMLYYRPRGDDFAPYVDDYANAWVHNVAVGTGETGYWYDFQYQVSLGKSTWAEIAARYPNGTIAKPAQQTGSAWPNPSTPDTPNACGISLEWGAEMYGLNSGGVIGGTTPLYTCPISSNNWWRECLNGIGWADNVQIGVNGGFPTQYDFEPAETRVAVTGCGNALQSTVTYKSKYLQPFAVYGTVCAIGAGNGEFELDEGSPSVFIQDKTTTIPKKIWCKVPGSTPSVSIGDKVRVFGVLVPGYSNRWYADGPVVNRFHTLDFPEFITPLE